MEPNQLKRVSGVLMSTAGGLFLIAGLLRRLQEPLWVVLGVVFVLLGVLLLRQGTDRT